MNLPAIFLLPPQSPGRVALAFAIAPLAGTAGLAAIAAMISYFTGLSWRETAMGVAAVTQVGFFVFALPPTLLLGIPAYLLLRNAVQPRLAWDMLAGALLPTIPYALLLPWALHGMSVWEAAFWFAIAAVLGGASGWVFWLVAGWRPREVARPRGARPWPLARPTALPTRPD